MKETHPGGGDNIVVRVLGSPMLVVVKSEREMQAYTTAADYCNLPSRGTVDAVNQYSLIQPLQAQGRCLALSLRTFQAIVALWLATRSKHVRHRTLFNGRLCWQSRSIRSC